MGCMLKYNEDILDYLNHPKCTTPYVEHVGNNGEYHNLYLGGYDPFNHKHIFKKGF